MFWELDRTSKVRIAPECLAKNINDVIAKELKHNEEGQITDDGYIVLAVRRVVEIGTGMISSRSGYCVFEVKYRAIVFYCHGDQVIDAVISSISSNGIRAEAGPLDIFVSNKSLPESYHHEIESSSFVDENGDAVLRQGTKVRIQLMTVRPSHERSKLAATGKMNDESLGYLRSEM